MHKLVIQTMLKDEEHILNEWIVYHILLGIEHIFIYDDNSKIPVSETIKELPKNILEKVTVYRLEELDSNIYNEETFINSSYYNENLYLKMKEYKQLYFLNHFVFNNKNVSEWCFFCDCDEFLYLNNNDNIFDFLKKYHEHDIIYIPWLMYGSSYHIEQPKGLVINNFTRHSKNYFPWGKSIAKLSEISNVICVHEIDKKNKKFFKLDHTVKLFELPIHINHYITNSIKLYLKRKLRIDIGLKNGNIRKYSLMYDILSNYNNIETNIMEKYSKEINNILKNNINKTIIKNDNIDFFYLNNKYIHKAENIEILYEMLQTDNLRYCKKDEFKYINLDNIPKDFNVKEYIELNKDLMDLNMTEIEAYLHYDNTGYTENRKYKYENIPEDFNAKEYVELNEDLKNLKFTELEGKVHYEYDGYKENRKYKYD
jgi:hypothetical protein